jgi:glycosyltransferase involved in cell wall biosynthesis
MKISLFSESFKPYLSGVTVSVDTFARGLVARGHDVSVYAPWYPDFIDAENYRVIRFPSLGVRAYPGFRLAIPGKVDFRNKPDIIHSHSPYQLGYYSQWLAKKHNIPFVYHFHTLFTDYLHFVPLPRWITEPIVKGIVRTFCRGCDAVIVPTPIVKNILISDYGVRSRIEVIPTGVDEAAVAAATPAGLREQYKIPAEAVVLQYCGRLSKEKNIEFIIDAYPKIKEKIPTAVLMIVGFGPHEEALRDRVRALHLANEVVFTGRVERKDIYRYLKVGDIFVCGSKTETQGLVLSEAKACGVPAVAIKAQGVAHMIVDGEDGFLVPDDLDAFVEKAVLLVQDAALRQKMSRAALENAAKFYTNAAVTKQLEAVYNSL